MLWLRCSCPRPATLTGLVQQTFLPGPHVLPRRLADHVRVEQQLTAHAVWPVCVDVAAHRRDSPDSPSSLPASFPALPGAGWTRTSGPEIKCRTRQGPPRFRGESDVSRTNSSGNQSQGPSSTLRDRAAPGRTVTPGSTVSLPSSRRATMRVRFAAPERPQKTTCRTHRPCASHPR